MDVRLVKCGKPPGRWELAFAFDKSDQPNYLSNAVLFGRIESGVDVLTALSSVKAADRSGFIFTLQSL